MEPLFSEFKPSTAADWKKQLLKDLKGEPPESLTWHNENGFDVSPFYTAEDLHHTYQPAFLHSDWQICVKGRGATAKEMNRQLLQDLNRGATAIAVHSHLDQAAAVLENIQLQYIHATFTARQDTVPGLLELLGSGKAAGNQNCTFIPDSLNSQQDLLNWCAGFNAIGHENWRYASADLLPYHHKGALAYYETALAFSLFNEYLSFFTVQGKPVADFVLKTGVDTDFFIQVAKLRAIRRLWEIFKKEYGITNQLYVICETSLANKAVADRYNNLLRSTVESMAAVAGGCNELIVNEFDALLPKETSLASRMAINQQLILKEECYLDKMADISCGSYYIESLTDLLAAKAFDQFKEFERQGGYFNCLAKGFFDKDISKQYQLRKGKIASGELPVIGVNKFRNAQEAGSVTPELLIRLQAQQINNAVLEFELGNMPAL